MANMGIAKRSGPKVVFFLASTLLSRLSTSRPAPIDGPANPTRVSIKTSAPTEVNEIKPDLKVNTDLVQVPVTVTDNLGRILEHLDRNDFTIYEDGVEQTIVHFSSEEVPVSMCLVIDSSGSMAGKFRKANEAILALLRYSNPEDEYCVVRFSDSPEVLVRMTRNSSQVTTVLNQIHPYGWTALLDAIHLSIQEVRTGHNQRKAIVLISDGGDNRSRHSEKSIKRLVRETEAQIYSIGIVAAEDKWMYPVQVDGSSLLRAISNESGGMLFLIRAVSDLPVAIEHIESALRHQYVLGYYPTAHKLDGKYRRVTIKLHSHDNSRPLKAYWRAGYYAPTE